MNNLHHINEDKYYFDDKAAKRAVDFIQTFCKHIKGSLAGERFILEEWQKKDIIEPLFGWKSKELTCVNSDNALCLFQGRTEKQT